MKFIIVLPMLVALAANQSTYSAKYDDTIDEERLKNATFLKAFVSCFTGTHAYCGNDEPLTFYKAMKIESIFNTTASNTTSNATASHATDTPAIGVNATNVNATDVHATQFNGSNSNTFDYLDVDAVVNNPGRLMSWYNCFMDKGPCDTIQDSFKKSLPHAIQQICAACTPKQKLFARKFIISLGEKAPAGLELFKKKFDPENKYIAAIYKDMGLAAPADATTKLLKMDFQSNPMKLSLH